MDIQTACLNTLDSSTRDSDSFTNSSFLENDNHCLQGNWELDVDSQQLCWSNNQYKIYGYEPNEFELNNDFFIFNTTHSSEIERIKKIVNDALKSNNEYSFRRRIIKKNGQLGFVETRAEIIRSEVGKPLKIKGITIDITAKQKEEYDYNDPKFFNITYDNYRKSIKNEIVKIIYDKDISEDLCQEVFLKIWNKILKYDPQKGSLYTWMVSIAKNHCKDYLKSKRNQNNKFNDRFEFSFEGKIKSSFIDLNKIEFKFLFQDLNVKQKELITLLFIEGYTQEEVSKSKKMPLGTVKTQSRAALRKLRYISEFYLNPNRIL